MKQRERLLEFFEERPNKWVRLPEITGLGIAQYNARIFDLRKAGYDISNIWKMIKGTKHSWYKYTPKEVN